MPTKPVTTYPADQLILIKIPLYQGTTITKTTPLITHPHTTIPIVTDRDITHYNITTPMVTMLNNPPTRTIQPRASISPFPTIKNCPSVNRSTISTAPMSPPTKPTTIRIPSQTQLPLPYITLLTTASNTPPKRSSHQWLNQSLQTTPSQPPSPRKNPPIAVTTTPRIPSST